MQLPIATISMTATNPDGTNTGTARLGIPVTFTSAETDTANSVLTWSLQGAGTITWSGTSNVNATYTPPLVMPTNPSVTLTVYLTNLPALTTSYAFTLVNPVPVVTSATPTQLLTGGSQTVTLTGSGFVPGTTVLMNGTSLPVTYTSPTQAAVQVLVAANATGTLTLQAQILLPWRGGNNVHRKRSATAITLTATGADGINTGYADMDFTVAMSAAASGSLQTAVNWSLVGPGSISSTGVYTPPSVIPSNPLGYHPGGAGLQSVHNRLVSDQHRQSSPNSDRANPAIVTMGSTTTLTLTGTGFVPTTVVEVNGATVPHHLCLAHLHRWSGNRRCLRDRQPFPTGLHG